MTAWILIALLSCVDCRVNGAISAEFATEQACQSAIAALTAEADARRIDRLRLAICVPKGGANG